MSTDTLVEPVETDAPADAEPTKAEDAKLQEIEEITDISCMTCGTN